MKEVKASKDFISSAFMKSSRDLPRLALQKLLEGKLKNAGVRYYKSMAKGWSEHLLSGDKKPFQWGTGRQVRDIDISFSKEDGATLQALADKAIAGMHDVIKRMTDDTGNLLFEKSTLQWREQRYLEERQGRQFRDSLEDRWGEALDLLRLLVSLSREIGESTFNRLAAAYREEALPRAILNLHIRACQVASEIICLLENGFADGAHGRWRTLHEIGIVCTFLCSGDNDLAERYLKHDAVEQKKALDRFQIDHARLGFRPPSKRTVASVQSAYKRAINKYGDSYKSEYGWAAKHLNLARPRFIDIQDASGRAAMHSHYKMASYNVHASSRALVLRIGSLEGNTLVAGATNAGIEEPGHALAVSLTIVTSHLYDLYETGLDQVAELNCLIQIRDKAVGLLVRADRQLRLEERDIQTAIADYQLQTEED